MSRSEVLYEPRGRGLGSIKPKDKEHKGAERHRGAGAGDLPGAARARLRDPCLGRATSIGQAGAAGGRWRPPLLTAVYETTGIRTARPNHGIGHIESKMG
jgi:hypothetical protein